MAESRHSPLPERHPAEVTGEHEEWVRSAVQAHGGALLRYALRLLKPAQADLARDVVQDTFVKLCQAQRAEVEDHLVEWLFTVCRNRSFDILRKESRMTVLSTFEGSAGTGERASGAALVLDGKQLPVGSNSSDAAAQEAVEKPETTSEVLGALAELPTNQQEVIRLKFQAGLSYREIAGVTNLTIANVGFLIHSGIKTLRQQFAEQSMVIPQSVPIAGS